MLISRIIQTLESYEVDFYSFDSPIGEKDYCYAIVVPESELAIFRGQEKKDGIDSPIGVYYYDCTHEEFFKKGYEKNTAATEKDCKLIMNRYNIVQNDLPLAYTLFVVLHEIGHVVHFKELGLSYEDYWYRFNGSRDHLFVLYSFCHNCICHNPREQHLLQAVVNEIYDNIPSEKYADEFALREFEKYWEALITQTT